MKCKIIRICCGIVKTPRLFALIAVVGIAVLSGGCSGFDPELADTIGNERPAPEPYVPEEQPGWTPDDVEVPELASDWSCSYDVTLNDDWHDDVVCTNGAEAHRPYLREWDDFVSEAELMESAREYESELNLGG